MLDFDAVEVLGIDDRSVFLGGGVQGGSVKFVSCSCSTDLFAIILSLWACERLTFVTFVNFE